MSQRRKETPRKNLSRDPIFDIEQVASATECTGILPAQIETAEQGESISRLQSIHTIAPRFIDGDDEH